jgi:putative PIG3 family NAD(P)H quinone oxidoreductase
MRAVIASGAGGPDVLSLGEAPDPVAAAGEVVVDVAAAGLNRADLLQRQGFYPPPPGASATIGMECSGIVSEVGDGVTGWQVGDRVCALLSAGGYAERVAVPAGQVMAIPSGIGLVEAAALPEVACTVWSNVAMYAGLRDGETLLVHGGSGGIGTFAIQLGKALGARVLATAGSDEKRDLCRELGADEAIDYRGAWEDGVAADVILDNMGAKYLGRNIGALAPDGRLAVIGMQGGTKGEIDLGALLRVRGRVIATNLRGRPTEQKAAICAEVVEHVWPLVECGAIRPVIGSILPIAEVVSAHELMESGSHTGKVLLRV